MRRAQFQGPHIFFFLTSPAPPPSLSPSLLSPSALLPPASLPPLPLRAEHPGPSRRARRTPARARRAHRRRPARTGEAGAEAAAGGQSSGRVAMAPSSCGLAGRSGAGRTSGPARVSFQSGPYRATDGARELALHFAEPCSARRCSVFLSKFTLQSTYRALYRAHCGQPKSKDPVELSTLNWMGKIKKINSSRISI